MSKVSKTEVTKVDFFPLPVQEGAAPEVRMVGREPGILAWLYPNGDAIIRTEAAFWYCPSGTYTEATK